MKILPPDPNDACVVRCEFCFVKIQYDPSEVETTYDSDHDAYYHIKCPRCSKHIDVGRPKL